VSATVTGIMATNKRSQYNQTNDGRAIEEAEDLKNSGQTLNLVTDVLLGGAVVAAGVSAVLYATRPEVTREIADVRVTPAPLPGGGGLWIEGCF
jgi:hypothetical protein